MWGDCNPAFDEADFAVLKLQEALVPAIKVEDEIKVSRKTSSPMPSMRPITQG